MDTIAVSTYPLTYVRSTLMFLKSKGDIEAPLTLITLLPMSSTEKLITYFMQSNNC